MTKYGREDTQHFKFLSTHSCVSWPIGRVMGLRHFASNGEGSSFFFSHFQRYVRTLKIYPPRKMHANKGGSSHDTTRKDVGFKAIQSRTAYDNGLIQRHSGVCLFSPLNVSVGPFDLNIFRKQPANNKSISEARAEVTSLLM